MPAATRSSAKSISKPTATSIVLELLDEARQIFEERQADYGDPSKNFDDISVGWSIILGFDVSPRQVAKCMIWTKLCRDNTTQKRDNMIDAANFALIGQAVSE